MSFPCYPKYKASGVEWLEEVPEHWGTGRLRRFARRYSGGTPDKTNMAYWQEGVIPWLNSGAVNDRLISEPSTFITTEAFANSSAKWVPAGALVMALAGQGKTKGMVAQLAIPSTCNQSMAAIVPNLKLNARFLLWWLDSNYQSIRNMAGGDLRDGLNLELVGDIPLPVPPLPEQTAIAEFLDRETGKIDELVAEQRRLMELLKEKRQAIISHAVTKGLNPNAPMKPSGIEWLGDVPEHWEVTRLGFLCFKIGSGKTPSGGGEAYLSEGVTFIRSQNVYDDGLRLDDVVYVSEETDAEQSWSRVFPGDILLNITGASLGRTCLVPSVFDRANVNQHVCILRLTNAASRTFTSMVLKSSGMKSQFDSAQNGAAREGLNFAQISKLALALPPQREQDAIVAFLDTELAKFDTLTAEAQRAIDLLQERRTALISAAVTGQIDVRQIPKN
jgi:type I restriction enzyme S subunit